MASKEQIEVEVRAHEFEIETSSTPDEIGAACEQAMKAATRFGHHKVVETAPGPKDGPNSRHFAVKSGFPRVLEMTVTWQEVAEGRRVTLTVDDYAVHQSVVAGFIPSGPKKAYGLPALERFSSRLRSAL